MKLSVIVPVYNVETYLRDCLDSLLNQDLDDDEYEIICVDDGSKDSSGAILDEYAEKHPNIVVLHKENAGVSAARNDALDMARGEYIHFVDSDDYFYPQVYGQLVDLATREKADVLLFHYEKVEADRSYKDFDFSDGKVICEITEYSEAEISSMVTRTLIQRSLIEAHSIRFAEGVFYGEDTLFLDFIACYAKKVIEAKEKLYFYRQGTGVSVKTDERAIAKRMLSAYRSALILKPLKETTEEKNKLRFINRRIAENVALACIHSLRCPKGVARQVKHQMATDKLYPYAASPLLGKLKRNKRNIILILLRSRLLFWFFDVCNTFRK